MRFWLGENFVSKVLFLMIFRIGFRFVLLFCLVIESVWFGEIWVFESYVYCVLVFGFCDGGVGFFYLLDMMLYY